MKLRPGDVICLDQRATQPLKVYVGERMNYLGELGRSQGKVATKILQRKGPVSLEEE
jgi:flagellar motor switch protein FliM